MSSITTNSASPSLYIVIVRENMRIYNYLALICLTASSAVWAQSAVQDPAGLNTIPKGATATNHFWQHLVIQLTRNPSAGDVLAINMPAGVGVADVDGDGDVSDEISVDNETANNTGYSSTAGSDSSLIRLVSTTGGKVGPVHVQFPITTSSNPSSVSAVYGLVTFSNTGETAIPAGTISLLYADPFQLNLATHSRLFVDGVVDTTTNRQGDFYPAETTAIFDVALPDLVSDRRASLASSVFADAAVPFGDSNDSNDVTYQFWFSATDSLSLVDTTTASAALDRSTGLPATVNEATVAELSFDVSGLAIGTHYLYTTSNLTGSFPLVRSRGVTVQHEPTVLSVGVFEGNDADFLDSGLLLNSDSGALDIAANSQSQISIAFNVVDFDDSASVRLFYSTSATLDTTNVTTTGSVPARTITGLTGAVNVDTTAVLLEGVDSLLTWTIAQSDTDFVAAADYYIYAVVLDGTDLAIGLTDYTYNVRHSPFLALDERSSRNIETGGVTPQRYYSINWNEDNGIDGDIDRNDSALIDLYYSASDSFAVPEGVAELRAAAADSAQDTHLIVAGIDEDADARDSNRYIWDLWSHTNSDDDGTPLEGVPYYLYGVISGGGTERLVRWEDGSGNGQTLEFSHSPHLRPTEPVGPMLVDGRQSFRVAWVSRDVDDAADIWVLLVPQVAALALGDDITYGDFAADGQAEWVATSSDGSAENGIPLNENTAVDFSVRPARLVRNRSGTSDPLADGEYFVYVVIDPSGSTPPAAGSQALRAPGPVTIQGLAPEGAVGLAGPNIEVLPARTVMTVTADTMAFEIRPHSAGTTVDVVSAFFSIDTTFVRVVDQDATVSGVQPFSVNAAQPGLTLLNTHAAGLDSTTVGNWLLDLVYFEQSGTDLFDGQSVLATIELVTKDSLGTTELHVNNHGDRASAFYRDGILVNSISPARVAEIDIRPRGQLAGRVRFQGRTDHTAEITILLREYNNVSVLDDSLFAATNDVNATVPGVQDSTDLDGGFSLTKIPRGRYHLAVHRDRYLDGQYSDLVIEPGDDLTQVDPVLLSDGITQAEFLLGGDVTGYVDSSGSSLPDNEIDQLDIDFVVSFFGQATTTAHAGRLADIDGDSLVWVNDLNMVAENFGTAGVDPVYKETGRPSLEQMLLRLTTESSGGEFHVQVEAEGASELRAYGLRVLFDESLSLISAHQGDLLGSQPNVFATAAGAGAINLGGALIGGGTSSADGTIAELRFRRQGPPGLPAVTIERADVVSGNGLVRPRLAAQLPHQYALLPNIPNPFNPTTSIRFTVPVPAAVSLLIFDEAGQRIRTILQKTLPAGMHSFEWDGRDEAGRTVGSGVYIARVNGPGFQLFRKMTLLK